MHIGLIGLGVMGANLARNAVRNGATVSVYNRTAEKTDAFLRSYGSEGHFVGTATLAEFVASLPAPRSIILMVNAGAPVDAVLAELCPLLARGDAIIDAGNSHFADTERRERSLMEQGISFLGMGVSGGEEGALHGPSMMPGGSHDAFMRLEPLLRSMAAKDAARGRCLAFLGRGGSGHFVKMVHNGIEYGDMQLIAETYHVLRAAGHANASIATIFSSWNTSRALRSFLIEITAAIFQQRDDRTDADLIDVILDAAKQKGTGRWTTEAALAVGVPIPTITAAVDARAMSAAKPLRVRVAHDLGALTLRPLRVSVSAVKSALLLSKICSYAQGFLLMMEADRVHGWGIDRAEVCRIWSGGCIIRSTLLRSFADAFRDDPSLPSLVVAPRIMPLFRAKHRAWRTVVTRAQHAGIAVPALSASLAYLDSLRASWLPQNLTQAQRDFFGAHTYERVDAPGSFHTQWSPLP